MQDPDDRFGMPESAFSAARASHGPNNPFVRLGMYVPTRREVAESDPEWLYSVLEELMWESPAELIPNNPQISDVRQVLLGRLDAIEPPVVRLIALCDSYLKT